MTQEPIDKKNKKVEICTTVTINYDVNWQLVEDLLVTAMEGGSNYWYLILTDLPTRNKSLPYVIDLLNQVKEGLAISIRDIEDSNTVLGFISKENIIESFSLLANCQTISHVLRNIIVHDNYDAEDADIWFQLVVMKEVNYG